MTIVDVLLLALICSLIFAYITLARFTIRATRRRNNDESITQTSSNLRLDHHGDWLQEHGDRLAKLESAQTDLEKFRIQAMAVMTATARSLAAVSRNKNAEFKWVRSILGQLERHAVCTNSIRSTLSEASINDLKTIFGLESNTFEITSGNKIYTVQWLPSIGKHGSFMFINTLGSPSTLFKRVFGMSAEGRFDFILRPSPVNLSDISLSNVTTIAL